MTKSESIKELADAFSKFQADLLPVKKGATNPFFKSKYADLASIIEAVRAPLTKNGLSVTQFPTEGGLTTILMHSSGEWMEETLKMIPKDNSPQAVGSVLTYARRYALGAVLGIATEEDDDGNTASGTNNAPQGKQRPSSPKPVAPSRPPVNTVEIKRKKITNLLVDLGLANETITDRVLVTEKIKEMTGLVPDPNNFDEIIGRLEVILSEKNGQ